VDYNIQQESTLHLAHEVDPSDKISLPNPDQQRLRFSGLGWSASLSSGYACVVLLMSGVEVVCRLSVCTAPDHQVTLAH